MRGKVKSVSLARRLVIDLMHASVPLVIVERTLKLERLVKARAALAERPGWTSMIAKAFCIVARDEPWLRTFYLQWPWPHFYVLPRSIAMAAIVRESFDKDVPILLKIGSVDDMPLSDVERVMQRGKTAPLDELPALRRVFRIGRLPLLLRRLLWWIGLNSGRQRANNFGTFGVTSLAMLGSETVVLNSPGPSMMTYGLVKSDGSMEILLHWDHRIYDGVLACRALQRLEEVLNGEIADELLTKAAAAPSS